MDNSEVEAFLSELSVIFQQNDVHQKAESFLKLKTYLPHVTTIPLKKRLFNAVISKVPNIFDDLLLQIESLDMLQEEETVVTQSCKSLIQLVCQILEVLVSCVQAISDFNDISHLLTKIVLQVLNFCYKHCEASSEIYGPQLSHLTDLLGIFFKLTLRLQSVSINIINRMITEDKRFQDSNNLYEICLELQSLCVLLGGNDLKMAHLIWKVYIRFVCHYHAYLEDYLDVESLLLELNTFCLSTVLDMKQNLLPQSDVEPKELNSQSKSIGFNINFVVMICEQFELRHFPDKLLVFILETYNLVLMTPLQTALSEDQAMSIRNTLCNEIRPLIQMLMKDNSLLSLLNNLSKEDEDIFRVPASLLKAKILAQASNISISCEHDSDVTRYLDLFENLLSELEQCDTELNLIAIPAPLVDINMKRSITLHEYMVLHLGTFLAKSCSCHISNLEESLLKSLFLEKDSVRLLVCDLWCFFTRYGPADLGYSHCCMLSRLSRCIKNSRSQMWLLFLLQRLIGQMSQEQKMQLENKFTDLGPEIFSKEESSVNIHPLHIFSPFHPTDVTSTFNVNYKRHNLISTLLEKNTSNDPVANILRTKLAMTILEISVLLSDSKSSYDAEVFLLNYSFWKSKSSCVQLYSLFCLGRLLKVGFHQQIEAQVLTILSSMFEEILTCGNSLYQYELLYLISNLACQSKHRSLVKGFAENPILRSKMKNFIKKVTSDDDTTWSDIVAVVTRQKEQMEKDSSCPISEDNNLPFILNKTAVVFDSSPERNPQIEKCLQDLAKVIQEMQKLLPLPSWATTKIDTLLQSIQTK